MPQEYLLPILMSVLAAASVFALVYFYQRGRHAEVKQTRRLHAQLDQAEQRIELQRQTISKLARESRTDFVTQLPNQTGLADELTRRSAEVSRYNLDACLLMIHLNLDEIQARESSLERAILQHIAELIRSQIRACDFAAHVSRNEFAVVLGHMTAEDAGNIAERLKRAIENHVAQVNDGQPIDIRARMGIAEVTEDWQACVELGRRSIDSSQHCEIAV